MAALIEKTQTHLMVNYVFAFAYFWVGIEKLTGVVPDSGFFGFVSALMAISCGVWGFIGFRWMLDGALGASGFVVFASAGAWGWTYFFGSLLCSVTGFVVVPIQIFLQRRLLQRLTAGTLAEASPTATPTLAA